MKGAKTALINSTEGGPALSDVISKPVTQTLVSL